METLVSSHKDCWPWALLCQDSRVQVAFEQQLATVMLSNEELRDPVRTYNPIAADQLATYVPLRWPWLLAELFAQSPSSARARVVASSPAYLSALGSLLRATPAAVVLDYLLWRALRAFAPSAFGFLCEG